MEPLYPPYDFLFIGILAFLLSYLIRMGLKRIPRFLHKLPFLALSYLIVSLSFAFIWDELPLKFYVEEPYDFEAQRKLAGPNIGAGLMGAIWYIASVLFNVFLWIWSLVALLRYFFLKPKKEVNNVQDN